jgi:toxin ParE1/3/4
MARLNWTDQSIQDMINIADFIAKDSVRYAKITIERIRSASQQLKVYPASGRKVPETDNDAIRELILGNYRIIYSIVSKDQIDFSPFIIQQKDWI